MIDHRIRRRRQVAIRVIHRLGTELIDIGPARRSYVERGETEALTIMAKVPESLAGLDCCEVLSQCAEAADKPFDDETFVGAVFIEGLARARLIDHSHAAVAHSVFYLRALGRIRGDVHFGYLQQAIDSGGVAALPMAVSVAGRLGLKDVVKMLERRIREAMAHEPDLYQGWLGPPE